MTIFVGGDAETKDSVQIRLQETLEWAAFQREPDELERARALALALNKMYALVPKKGAWWMQYVQPACECDFFLDKIADAKRARQSGDRLYRGNSLHSRWCTHSAAFMFKLAHRQERDPLFLVKMHSFKPKPHIFVDLTYSPPPKKQKACEPSVADQGQGSSNVSPICL